MSRDGGLPTTFRGYRQVLFGLASDLQRVEDRAPTPELQQRARELRQRVEERRFTVAVLGEFKRGKSTFINALLGAEVLPSDIAPTTATINRVVYGLTPRATLLFKDGREEDIPVDQLDQSITKLTEAAAEKAASVKEAVVSWPIRFCRNDVDLLDTPGLGDEEAMSRVTREILPDVDAALFVVMANSPFSETEAAFLDELLEHDPGRILFVVTAMDRIRKAKDRPRVLADITARIAQKLPNPKVFGLSGIDALDARLEGDDEALAASGLLEFEAFLEEFLTTSDGVGLARRLTQTAQLCDDMRAARAPSEAATEFDHAALRSLVEATNRKVEQALTDWRALVREQGGPADTGVERAKTYGMNHTRDRLGKLKAAATKATDGAMAKSLGRDAADLIWQDLIDSSVRALQPLAEQLTLAWLPGLAQLERVALAADHVVEHVAQALGEPTTSTLHADLGIVDGELTDGLPTLDLSSVVVSLVPPRAALARSLTSDTVTEPLTRTRNQNLMAFVSSVLQGPEKDWMVAAEAAVEREWTQAWEAKPPGRALRDWQEVASGGVSKPLSAAITRLRELELAIETRQHRAQALAERDKLDSERDGELITTVAARARALAEELNAAVS
ncbi:MAG: hypothetical protein GY913_30240 [Proteobacteria bacterium]|nr:hypothetical protein [Pseudomonadota bacterium]MCP4921198.1 hypothetical protein [Pseudomonadota bacterium]